jgi:hypothetical protein
MDLAELAARWNWRRLLRAEDQDAGAVDDI